MRLPLMVLAFLLVGCSAPEPQPDDPDAVLTDPDAYYADHYCVREDVEPRVLAPDGAGTPWRLGDWWAYRLDTDGTEATTVRMVYYDDQDVNRTGVAQHYMVGTADREQALEHAVWSTNPVLGRIHRLLYSPHEQGFHADMFNFPLCDGNQWQTGLLDRVFSMTATSATLTLPDGSTDAGFRISGSAPDGSTISYHYAPAAKWFTDLRLDRTDGAMVDMRLTGTGSGESGEFFFLRGQKDHIIDVGDLEPETAVQRGDGAEGPYDILGVYLDLQRQGSDRLELRLLDPAGELAACVGLAGSGPLGGTDCPAPPLLVEVPWQAGDWTVRVGKSPLSGTEASGEVRLVSIYDRSGTL